MAAGRLALSKPSDHNIESGPKHGGMTVFSLHVKGRHPGGDDIHGVDAIPQMIKAISAIYDTKLSHQPWSVEGLPWAKIGSIIGGRGESYDLRSVSRNSDLCTAFVAVSTVPGMTAATIRTDLERTLRRLKSEDPDFDYQLVHPVERKFRTWILDHPPMDMPVDQDIVRALVSGYKQVTGHEPKGVGPPATQLGGPLWRRRRPPLRIRNPGAHLWPVRRLLRRRLCQHRRDGPMQQSPGLGGVGILRVDSLWN